MDLDERHIIASVDDFRALTGPVPDRIAKKSISFVDNICRAFIAASPYVLIGTRGADGLPDVSPRGDPAGFVHVADDRTLLIPDRPGNRRHDTFENILSDPGVALLFVIPGRTDTLRIAGRATITNDPELRATFAHRGNIPDFVLVVSVAEAFMHCSKSSVRAHLWKQEHWPDATSVPSLGEAIVQHAKLDTEPAAMDRILRNDEKSGLY